MEENILESIKDLLGINKEDEAFNNDILVNINASFSTLYQLGVGSEDHYVVITGEETWDEVFSEKDLIDLIKLYTYMKVRIVFDPPTNSSILQSFNEQMKETEYRILLQADPSDYFDSSYVHDEEDKTKSSMSFEKVESLPSFGKENVIYLVPNGGSGNNLYDEYYWNEEDYRFELFGTVRPKEGDDYSITDSEIDNLFK